jgi:hypothetical protein
VHKRIVSAVRRVEFVSDRMPYIVQRGHWCNIIVVNVHAPCEDTSDSFYEEIGRVFDQSPRLSSAKCSPIAASINTPGPLLMEIHTTR